jgi:hypothetical protein
MSEFAITFAARPISAPSAGRFGHSVAVVVSGPIAGAALTAATANPTPEAYPMGGRARHRNQPQSITLPARTSFLNRLATTMRAIPGFSEAKRETQTPFRSASC